MRSIGGLTLLTGIGVALFVYMPTPVDSAALLDRLQRVVGLRYASMPVANVAIASRLGAFSPSIALSMIVPREPRRAGLETAAAPAPGSERSQVPIARDAPMGWETIVSTTKPAPSELTPRDPRARSKLVLEIQQELRRVGCYRGRMDGSWEYGTKNAMKEFTDHVNATLPLDQPDYIQLTLIQSQRDGGLRRMPRRPIFSGIGTLCGTSRCGADGSREAERGAPLEGRGAVQAGASGGAFFRTVVWPHGDRRPSPNIGQRATASTVRRARNRGHTTTANADRRTRSGPPRGNRSGATGDGWSKGGAPVEQRSTLRSYSLSSLHGCRRSTARPKLPP